jgi:hypothetical protein
MSTDGTYEFLIQKNIPNHRVDTNSTFDLVTLQNHVTQVIHTIKPAWVIYHGADLFFYTEHGIRKNIEEAEIQGFNRITLNNFSMGRTEKDPQQGLEPNKHFYYFDDGGLELICKYDPSLTITADSIFINNPKDKIIPREKGFMVNWGPTKSLLNRKETMQRRTKAWTENRMSKEMGTHYTLLDKVNWLIPSYHLQDIRTHALFLKFNAEMNLIWSPSPTRTFGQQRSVRRLRNKYRRRS